MRPRISNRRSITSRLTLYRRREDLDGLVGPIGAGVGAGPCLRLEGLSGYKGGASDTVAENFGGLVFGKSREFVSHVADPTLPKDYVNEFVHHREDPTIGGVRAIQQYHGQRPLVDRHASHLRDIHAHGLEDKDSPVLHGGTSDIQSFVGRAQSCLVFQCDAEGDSNGCRQAVGIGNIRR